MTGAGLSDLLISYNLVGAHKLARLAALLRRTALTVGADHPAVVAGLAGPRRGPGVPSTWWWNATPAAAGPG